MISEELSEDKSPCQDFEALSVSKRLVKSASQKWRKKNHKGEMKEDKNSRGISPRCLTLYGRSGGCKVGADTVEDFGDPGSRRRSSASKEGKGHKMICGTEESGVNCFPYGVKEKFWKKNNRKDLECEYGMHFFLPDDILEMCLVRLPLTSLMNARLVCKKWRFLTTAPRFLQMRREGSYQTPWLFLFGAGENGYRSSEIHVLDVSLNQWHKVDARVLTGRFMFSVTNVQEDVYVVGGCSSLSKFGRLNSSLFITHRDVLVFNPLTKSWRKVAPMNDARSTPILGCYEVSSDFSIFQSQQNRQDRHFTRSRVGSVSDVYEDPHRLSLRRQHRSAFDENDATLLSNRKSCKFIKQKGDQSHLSRRRFVLIVVGGTGSWDKPLSSGEIYDPVSNKWMEIQRLPVDLGVLCSGVVCNRMFYVYSESDKLAAYDFERGFWIGVQTTPFPPRVHEYYPKLVSCNGRLFMVSVSWCEGDGEIGRRNKAVRKVWEVDLKYPTWTEVSVHPDAPMDWNAAFVSDRNLIFGVEMFKIFGQMLNFFTMCSVSDSETNWSHISRNRVASAFDASSCMTKQIVVMHL